METRGAVPSWAVLLLVLDVVWIWAHMGPRYATLVQRVQGGRPMRVEPGYALLAYGAMLVGMQELVRPAQDRVRAGAAWGLLTYGTWNGTAGAVFQDWDAGLAAQDIAWGVALGMVVARAM